MKHQNRIIIAAFLLTGAGTFLFANDARTLRSPEIAKQPKPITNCVPAVKKPVPVPPTEVMSLDGRRPHFAPRPGEILEMTCRELGNFEFDQEKGEFIPQDVRQLNGVTVRLRGYMWPMEQGDQIHQFGLAPTIVFKPNSCAVIPPLIQHLTMCDCPKARPAAYLSGEIVVEGKLTVEIKKEDGYIMSLFSLDVTSVKPAAK